MSELSISVTHFVLCAERETSKWMGPLFAGIEYRFQSAPGRVSLGSGWAVPAGQGEDDGSQNESKVPRCESRGFHAWPLNLGPM